MYELIVLGSGTGIPSLRRASPGLAIKVKHHQVLIDSGPGTLRRMLEAGITYLDTDLLLYTHIHPDHVADLVPFLFACRYTEVPREKSLTCIGGPGFLDYFSQIRRIYGPWIEPESYELRVEEIKEKPVLLPDLKISARPMSHMPQSVGFRLDMGPGRTITVSGDTDYCREIVELAEETDLLILECSFPEGKKVQGHLTPSLAGRIAKESRSRKLLLTHLYPLCDQVDIVDPCKEAFQGDVIVAEDLMRMSL